MKLRNFILLCTILLIAIALIGSCATRRKAISETDFLETISGTWINTDYESTGVRMPVQKVVFYTDYKWEEYSLVKHDTPQAYGVYTITDTWKDSDGDIWYTGKWGDNLLGKGYCMGKISDSGNTHEMLWNIFSEPIEYWDLDNKRYYYRIHYRQ